MRALILLFLCASVLYSQDAEPKRLALLLGNSAYLHLPALPDVPGELDQLSQALKNAGFDVTVERDFTQEKLQTKTVADFIAKIHAGDICFFYFSGYGTQAQQDSFLLPVEFDPAAAKQDVSSSATSLTAIQQILDQYKAGLKILTLEASRSNPLLVTQGIGLANPDAGATRETLFAFSASPNHWAPDHTGVFTKYLAGAIEKKGLSLDEVFRDVSKQSNSATSGKQQTFFLPNVTQDFFFHKPEKAPEPVVVTPPPPRVIEVIKEVPQTGRAVGTLHQNPKDKEDYVWIPPATFKMGCVPSDTKCKPEEKPQHQVTLTKGFWMGRNEVMTLSYERYVEADKKNRKMPARGPSWDEKWKLVDSHYPMAEITADEAAGYCEWAGGRLPTEAEWEYAARAGDTDQIFPLKSDVDSREQANFLGTRGNDKWEQAAPVGRFNANAFNLLDMAGNVWEWCGDLFSKTYFQESPAVDPPGPNGNFPQHVVRGGSWYSDVKEYLRISYREGHNAGNTVGFRCVLPDGPATDKLLQIR
jgi:formylglycine-generating enzyme required for sulfatase activity